jgi:hypothetical protein
MSVDRHDRRLTISLTSVPGEDGDGEKVIVVAVETQREGTMNGIFSDHQHKNLGYFPSTALAQQASDAYCLEWLSSPSDPKCHCTEIATAPL